MEEFTKKESSILKAIAILFMVGLHLFNRADIEGYYRPFLYIGNNSLIYILSYLFDACVPLFLFSAGYASYVNKNQTFRQLLKRLLKLLINFWIVIIFTIIMGIIFKSDTIPGTLSDFMGNIFLYDINYVGAWWFMQTYVILTLISPLIMKLFDKFHACVIVFVSLLIYFIAYYFRIMNPLVSDIYLINILINTLVLMGTSLLSYIIGILFRKFTVITKIRSITSIKHNVYGLLLILICIVAHWIVKSLIVAPFIAIVFVIAYSLINFNKNIEKILLFFSKHSTNIWLVHMQFYMIFMKDLVFSTNTVLGCFVIVLVLSILSSYLITFFTNKVNGYINKRSFA